MGDDDLPQEIPPTDLEEYTVAALAAMDRQRGPVLRKVDPDQLPPPLNRAERRLMKKLKKRP